MKRIFVLLTVSVALCMTAGAQSFRSMWKQVDAFMEADAPESACETASRIFEKAKEKSDDHQMLRSALYMMMLGEEFEENYLQSGMDRLRSIIPDMRDTGCKALCHFILASSMMAYLYDYYDSESTCYSDSIEYHMGLAVELARAADRRSRKYADIIELPWLDEDAVLYPRLTDFILYVSMGIDSYTFPYSSRSFFENPMLIGTAEEFLQATETLDDEYWLVPVRSLRQLTQRNMNSSDLVRSNIDMLRIEMIYWDTYDFDRKTLAAACMELFHRWKESSPISGYFAYRAADWLSHDSEMKETALDMCRYALEKWPDGSYASKCRSVLEPRRQEKYIGLDMLERVCAGTVNKAVLSYTGTEKVWIRIVERNAGDMTFNEELMRRQIAARPLLQWTEDKLPQGQEHDGRMLEIPALPEGSYTMLASDDSLMTDSSYIAMLNFQCSSLTFLQMKDRGNSVAGMVLDMVTGETVSSCTFTLKDGDGNVIRSGSSDGFIDIDSLDLSQEYLLESISGERHGYSSVKPAPKQSRFLLSMFADRSVYRPGDTIRYSGLLTETDGMNPDRVIPDSTVNVSFIIEGIPGKQSFTHVTDMFGTFQGTYVIPDNAVTGSSIIMLPDESGNYEEGTWPYFTIRTVQQNGFTVELNAAAGVPVYDETMTFEGSALTYLKQPVTGAKVRWQAHSAGWRNSDMIVPGLRKTEDGMLYAEGETTVGDDGRFSFQFSVKSDMVCDDNEVVTVDYTVTDVTGQSQSGYNSFTVYDSLSTIMANKSDIFSPEERVWNDSIPVVLYRFSSWLRYDSVRITARKLERTGRNGFETAQTYRLGRSLDEAGKNRLFPQPRITAGATVYDKVLNASERIFMIPVSESGDYRICAYGPDGIALDSTDVFNFIPGPGIRAPQNRLLSVFIDNMNSTEYVVGDSLTVYAGSCEPGTRIFWMTGQDDGESGSFISDGTIRRLRIPVGSMTGHRQLCMGAYRSPIWESSDCYFNVTDPGSKLTLSIDGLDGSMNPGNAEQLEISVKDSEGRPVRARLLLDMYDLSVEKGTHYSNSWKGAPGYNPQFLDIDMPYVYSPECASWNGDGYSFSLDYALQGRFAGLKGIAFNSVSLEQRPAAELTRDELEALMRRDLDPTGLFRTSVTTDSRGRAVLRFNAPDRLAQWHFQAFAFTQDMKHALLSDTVITRRNIMIQPSVPAYLVQGDSLDFTSVLTNSLPDNADVRVRLEIQIDDMIWLDEKTVTVPAGERATVSFPVTAPAGFTGDMTYRITAVCGKDGDGEEDRIPVLDMQSVPSRLEYSFGNTSSDARTLARNIAFDGLLGRKAGESAIDRLFSLQNADGGWSWIPGGISRTDITTDVMLSVACMLQDGTIASDGSYRPMIEKALQYIDSNVSFSLKDGGRIDGMVLDCLLLPWNLTSSDNGTKREALKTALAAENRTYMTLAVRAKTAYVLEDRQLATSLVERSLFESAAGRWWRDNTSGNNGRDSQTDTQAWLVRSLKRNGFVTESAQAASWLDDCLDSGSAESHEKAGLAVSRRLVPGRNKVTVILELKSDRPLDCVQINDLLPANLMPVNMTPHHGTSVPMAADGTSPEYETGTVSYYNAPGRFSNLFLIEHLDRGTYTISYDCNITHTGRFGTRTPAVN